MYALGMYRVHRYPEQWQILECYAVDNGTVIKEMSHLPIIKIFFVLIKLRLPLPLFFLHLMLIVDCEPVGSQTCRPGTLIRKLVHFEWIYLIEKLKWKEKLFTWHDWCVNSKPLYYRRGKLMLLFKHYATASFLSATKSN